MGDDKPPQPLDYPQDHSLRSIRRGVRMLVLLSLVNTTLLGAGLFAPQIVAFAKQEWAAYQKAQADKAAAELKKAADDAAAAQRAARRPNLERWQSEAMTFALPADTLIYADDFAPGTLPARGATSATLPSTRQAVGRTTSPAAATRPAFWNWLPIYGQNAEKSEAFLFLHARRARPEATERIVLLTMDIDAPPNNDRFVRARTYVPMGKGDSIQPATNDSRAWRIELDERKGKRPALRFYAGQPDPTDESRFIIDYELGDARGRIIGRLLSTDRVDLVVTEGPLPQFSR